MKKVISAISVAMDSACSRGFLSEMRIYLSEGFSVEVVKDRYLYFFGDPGINDAEWLVVRDSILPVVNDLDCKFGEFGVINWEDDV